LAGRLLSEAHELTDTPLGEVFPLLGPCSSGKKVKGENLLDPDNCGEEDEEAHKGMTKE
jgi:hypothetical protein